MARYRLRFLLQEIDLSQGETLIGRSTSCHVTIEDPLVSRQHARILVDGDRATVEDLGSRNGVQVGGRTIRGLHELRDGDRIRVGTQELVFCRAAAAAIRGPGTRPTGFMTHCADCGIPYPAELTQCPNCGSSDRNEEDTLSGLEAERNWSLRLVVEVLERARTLGRWAEVERILERTRNLLGNGAPARDPVDPDLLGSLAAVAIALAVQKADSKWARWVLARYAANALVPSPDLVVALEGLPPSERQLLQPEIAALDAATRARGGSESELGVLSSLTSLYAS